MTKSSVVLQLGLLCHAFLTADGCSNHRLHVALRKFYMWMLPLIWPSLAVYQVIVIKRKLKSYLGISTLVLNNQAKTVLIGQKCLYDRLETEKVPVFLFNKHDYCLKQTESHFLSLCFCGAVKNLKYYMKIFVT